LEEGERRGVMEITRRMIGRGKGKGFGRGEKKEEEKSGKRKP